MRGLKLSPREQIVRDIDIIALFDRRDEQAIAELAAKHGKYCRAVAVGVLKNEHDADECLNDAYLKVWNSIPPAVPGDLRAYAAAIVRNTAIDRYRRNTAGHTIPPDKTVPLDQLRDDQQPVTDPWTDPVGLGNGGAQAADGRGTDEAYVSGLIAEYLRGLDPKKRELFFARYYYGRTIEDIAAISKRPKGTVLSILKRVRDGLRSFLKEKGIDV